MDASFLIGPSNTAFSTKADVQRSINFWTERVEGDSGISAYAMYRSPGLLPYITGLPTFGNRGQFELNGHDFIVNGTRVYDYQQTVQVANYGPIANDGRRVFMAGSQTSLMIVSAGRLYRINSATLTEISLSFVPIGIAFLKNYFVILSQTLSQFYWSTDDGASFPAANVQTAEADANANVALATIHQQLFVIGNRVTQPFYVGSNPRAPFVPNDGGIAKSGTEIAASVKALGESLYWLESTKDGTWAVIRLEGYTPHRVSTHAIASTFQELARTYDLSDAIADSYQWGKHQFYRITFPAADRTFEYHANQDEWEEPLWWDWRNGVYHRHRAASIVFAFGRLLAADHTNGLVYEMSPFIYHDFGFPLRALRRSPHIIEENADITYERLELGIDAGNGLAVPLWLNSYTLDRATFVTNLQTEVTGGTVTAAQQTVLQQIYDNEPYTPLDPYPAASVMTGLGFTAWGDNPLIALRYSNDGGKSYGNTLSRSMGRAGNYTARAAFDRLGIAHDRVWELEYSDPCKFALTFATMEAEVLS